MHSLETAGIKVIMIIEIKTLLCISVNFRYWSLHGTHHIHTGCEQRARETEMRQVFRLLPQRRHLCGFHLY